MTAPTPEEIDAINGLIGGLSDEEAKVIVASLRGEEPEEIAKFFGLSTDRVIQINHQVATML